LIRPEQKKSPESGNVGWHGKTTNLASQPTFAGSEYGIGVSNTFFVEAAVSHSVFSLFHEKNAAAASPPNV
jgi:hypothetical protein